MKTRFLGIIIMIMMILTTASPLLLPSNNTQAKTTEYLPRYEVNSNVEKIDKQPFITINEKTENTLTTQEYATFDEGGVYSLEWSIAPGGKLLSISPATLDTSGYLGYVALEGSRIRAYAGASLSTIYWELVDEDAMVTVTGDIDSDSLSEVGVVSKDAIYIIDDTGSVITSYPITVSNAIVGSAFADSRFVAIDSAGNTYVWDTKALAPATVEIPSAVWFSSNSMFLASGDTLYVYTIASLASGSPTSIASYTADSQIVVVSGLEDGTTTYIAVGTASGTVNFLVYEDSSLVSAWSTHLQDIPDALVVVKPSSTAPESVYVASGGTLYRVSYGYVVGSITLPSVVSVLKAYDVDGNGFMDILAVTGSGEAFVLAYDLDVLYSGFLGPDVVDVFFGDFGSADLIVGKYFEVLFARLVSSEVSVVSRFLTGNEFYASVIIRDDSGSYKILAGGSNGILYELSLYGEILDTINLGGNITQIIPFVSGEPSWFAVNNGSLVFVSSEGQVIEKMDYVSKIGVGVFNNYGDNDIIVLTSDTKEIYLVAGVTSTPVLVSPVGNAYRDFVIAHLVGGVVYDYIVAIRDLTTTTFDIIDIVNSATQEVTLAYDIVSAFRLDANPDKIGFVVYSSSTATYGLVVYSYNGGTGTTIYRDLGIETKPQSAGAYDMDGDLVDEIGVVIPAIVPRLEVFDIDLNDLGATYEFDGDVVRVFYLNMDNDTADEIVASLSYSNSYGIIILDGDGTNYTILFKGTVAGALYSVSGLDVDNDMTSEIVLSMSGLQYLNRRTVYIQLLSPSGNLIGWWSSILVRWKVYSEDPIQSVIVTVKDSGGKIIRQYSDLPPSTSSFNLTLENAGNYTVTIQVISVSKVSCEVAFWYYFDPTTEPIPVEVSIIAPEPNQEVYGPITIAGQAKGLTILDNNTVLPPNITVVIDGGEEVYTIEDPKPIGVGKWYWELKWDPFGYEGIHRIDVIATNGTQTSMASVEIDVVHADIYVWAKYDGNPDPEVIGTFLPNVTVMNYIYIKVAWPITSISRVYLNLGAEQVAATYDSKNNYWYVALDMGKFSSDTTVEVVVEGTNGKTLVKAVKIEILELPLWLLELVDKYTGGIVSFEWNERERAYIAQTDVVSLIDFLEKTGILKKAGIDFTIPKEIPIFGEKLTLVDLGIIIGFKLYITKYLAVWTKASLTGQILDKNVMASLYVQGVFDDELQLIKILIDVTFGITNLVTFTYQHIIPFTVAGIPINVRLGISLSVDAFLSSGATINGNWTIEYFMVDFNPVVRADAWAYLDVALGLVSVGVIVSPTVDIHGIYKYTIDEGSSWGISASLTIPYKVVVSLFFNAIKKEVLSGVLGPYTWSTGSATTSLKAYSENANRVSISSALTNTTLLQHATIASNGKQSMAVWIQGDELAYSMYNGYSWSKPLFITNDGIPKSDPTVAPLPDGRWMVIWTQADTVGDLSTLRLYYSILDENGWTVPTRVTDSGLPEGHPKAVLVGDKIYLVYLVDSDGSLETKDWTLWYTVYDGSWSSPVKVTNDYPVVSPSVANVDGSVYVSYVVDLDGDFTTPDNQELRVTRIGGRTLTISSGALINSPEIMGYGGDAVIAWVEALNSDNETYYVLRTANVFAGEIVDSDTILESKTVISQPKFVEDEGKLRLFWIESTGAGDTIKSAIYSDGSWVEDLEQDGSEALWTHEFAALSSWIGVLSEPYTMGVRVVTKTGQYLLTMPLPSEASITEIYKAPSVTGGSTGSTSVAFVAGVPLGVIVGLLGAVFSSRPKRRKFIVAE